MCARVYAYEHMCVHRAFANNKLSLPAVEALGDLVNARTQSQRRLALRQLQEQHKLYDVCERWKQMCVMHDDMHH